MNKIRLDIDDYYNSFEFFGIWTQLEVVFESEKELDVSYYQNKVCCKNWKQVRYVVREIIHFNDRISEITR